MARLVMLCDEFGSENVEIEGVKVGHVYDLHNPIVIKDKDGNERGDIVTSIAFDKAPTRGMQKAWEKIKNEDDKMDKMVIDLTGLTSAQVDELSLIDLKNTVELVSAFLPETKEPEKNTKEG